MFLKWKKITNTRSVRHKDDKHYSNYIGKKDKNAKYLDGSLAKTNDKVENHPVIFLETTTNTNEVIFATGNFTSQETTKLQWLEARNEFVGEQLNGKTCNFVRDDAKFNVLSKSKENKLVLEITLEDIEKKTSYFQITTDDDKAVKEVVRMMNEQLQKNNIDARFDNEIVTRSQFVTKITENITNDKNTD